MEFGVCLPNYGLKSSKEGLIAAATRAEALGYRSVWATDHVLVPPEQADPYGRTFEALVSLAHVAAATERVLLGTSVLVLPQREPILVAKQVATLDALSDGRVLLGVGSGWMEEEFRMLGASFHDRGARASEYLMALRALWASPHPEFEGRTVRFAETAFEPLPDQEGGPPFWIGGSSPAAIRRAARLGDVWHPTHISPRRVEALQPRLRREAGQRRVGVAVRIRVRFGVEDGRPPEERQALGGDPPAMQATIRAYQTAGVESLILYFGDLETGPFVEAMERFSRDVVQAA